MLGSTIRLWYIPCITPLSALSDTLDGVDGWEQIVINHAAMQCLINNEQDTGAIMQQQMLLQNRLDNMIAASRDEGEPTRVACASDENRNSFYAATGVLGAPGDGWGDDF